MEVIFFVLLLLVPSFAGAQVLQQTSNGALSAAASDSAYVNVTGDTMTGQLTVASSLTVTGASSFVGNIGIGSVAGANALKVTGVAGQYASVINGFTGASSFGLQISAGSDGSTESALAVIQRPGNGGDLFKVLGNGEVSAAQGKFSVGGSTLVVANGVLKLEAHDDEVGAFLKFRQGNNSAYGFDWFDDTLTTGNLYLKRINNNVATTAIEFERNNAGINFPEGDFSVGGSTLVVANGDVTLGGNLRVGVNSSIDTASGYTIIRPATDLYLRSGGTSNNIFINDNTGAASSVQVNAAGGTFSVGGSTLVVSGGLVGVNIAPVAGVSHNIGGIARITGLSTFANLGLKDGTASGSTWDLFSGYPALGDFTIRESGVDNRLVIKKTSGNVGIGTTAPGQNLTVYGTNAIAAIGSDDGVYIQENGAFGEVVGINPGVSNFNALGFRATSGTQLYLNTDGNVGIAVTDPDTTLEVNGQFKTGIYTLAAMDALAPTAVGAIITVSNSAAPYSVCVATATAAGSWVKLNTADHCQ